MLKDLLGRPSQWWNISGDILITCPVFSGKIAISNHRILYIDDHTVTISYKDYRAEGQKKTMTLSHGEFIRRFALHILPKRFIRIRHYGILSSSWKSNKLPNLKAVLTAQPIRLLPTGIKHPKAQSCPCCKTGRIITIMTFGRRGPPSEYNKAAYENPTSQKSC